MLCREREQVHLGIGETVDRYKVEAVIGQGGMAVVYRVRHGQLDSAHALKVLAVTGSGVHQRLIREGRVQANLRHPNVVSVTDVLDIGGSPALVMELVDGPALDTWLLEHLPTLEEALWLFRGVLRGVAAAHARGVVHRDLKPANVLLAPSDEGFVPKVTDFGLVKSLVDPRGDTQTGVSLGTPEYMSPEQIRDASDIDTRADLWALGCILYELTCHRRAFQGVDKHETFTRICAGSFTPPRQVVSDLPDAVGNAIERLLRVDRDQRLGSCEELHDLLYRESTPMEIGRIDAPARPVVPLRVHPTAPPTVPVVPPIPPQLLVPTVAPASPRVGEPSPAGPRPRVKPAEPITRGPWEAMLPGAVGELWARAGRSRTAPVAAVAVALLTVGVIAWGVSRPPHPEHEPSLRETVLPPPQVLDPVVVELPPEEPLDDRGAVRVIGDARQVWLVADGLRFAPDEELKAGHYQVVADFGGEVAVGAGLVEVRAGQRITLSCSASIAQCRVL